MNDKKYRVVCYIRIDPPDGIELLTECEALLEVANARAMQPENIYRIEEIDETE